jgi:hypothetical protein
VDPTVIVIIVIVVVLALAVGGWVLARQRRSQRLQEHYGDEYERSVEESGGDRKAAEAALTERETRVRDLDIRDLSDDERSGFQDRWAAVQRDFVDDPARALHSADDLVVEVMRVRGYPADGDFDRRAEDISVKHPEVVRHYRDARAVRDSDGSVDTEKQRTAMTSYRSLVEALLGKHDHSHDHADHADHRADDHAERTDHVDRADRDRADHDRPDAHLHNGTHRTDATAATTEEQTR